MCGCASLQMGRCNVLISYLLCHIHVAIDPVGIQRSVETAQQPTVKSHRDESVPRSGKIPITVGAAYGRTRAGTNYPRRGLRTARGKNETSSKPQAFYSTRSGLREHPAPSPTGCTCGYSNYAAPRLIFNCIRTFPHLHIRTSANCNFEFANSQWN